MAIPAFHFSGVYKEMILNGRKTASVLVGGYSYPLESPVLVYISEAKNLFDDDPQEKRHGNAIIKKNKVMKMSELDHEKAWRCGYDSSKGLILAMKKWFPGLKDDSIITYVEFKLEN